MGSEKRVTRFDLKDKGSTYSRSWRDRLRTRWLLMRHPSVSAGENTVFRQDVTFRLADNARMRFGHHCTINERACFALTKPAPIFEMGDYSGIGMNNIIAIKDHLKIGNHVRIAANVSIMDNQHGHAASDLIMNQPARIAPVSIGDDVWIGQGVIILPGVDIGQGSVVGAGAVVTKNIPPYEIWAGVPAKLIKKRI